MYYSSRNEIYNSSIFYHDFLLTDSNVGKHIDVLSLGESSEHFLGSIVYRKSLRLFFVEPMGLRTVGTNWAV